MATINDSHRLVFSVYRLISSYGTERVRSRLSPVGLDEAEITRGRTRIAAVETTRPQGRRLRLSKMIGELLDWSRENVPVIRAVLHDTNPALEEAVFNGVSPSTNSSDDLYFVELVCQRVLALNASTVPLESAAWAVLVKHGVTETELTSVLARCASEAHFDVTTEEATKAHLAALNALAAYHKKWSRIARARIKDRTVLHMMGIGRFGTRKGASEEVVEPEAPVAGTPVATEVAAGAGASGAKAPGVSASGVSAPGASASTDTKVGEKEVNG